MKAIILNLSTINFHFLVGPIRKTIVLSVLAHNIFAFVEKEVKKIFLKTR